MVEFALILPILLMLVVGIIQFGFALNAQISIQAAAREGARAAAVGGNGVSAAQNSLGAINGISQFNVNAGPACSATVTGDDAVVTVTAVYTFSIPFVPNLGAKTLTATARMRCEI